MNLKRIFEQVIFFALIVLGVANVLWIYFGMFIGHGVVIISPILLIIPTALIILIAFIFLCFKKFKPRKFLVVWAANILLPLFGIFTDIGTYLYFYWQKNALDTFVTDILSDRKIYEMTDCLRYSRNVNTYSSNADSANWHEYLTTSLAKDSIPAERFDRYLRNLQEIKCISFKIENNCVIFCYDGFVSNEFGFLYLIDGDPPKIGDEVEWGRLGGLYHISGKWYRYGIT